MLLARKELILVDVLTKRGITFRIVVSPCGQWTLIIFAETTLPVARIDAVSNTTRTLTNQPYSPPWDCATLQSSQLTSKGMPHGSMGGAAAAGCTERGKPPLPALLPFVLCHTGGTGWATRVWGARWGFVLGAGPLCPGSCAYGKVHDASSP